MSSQTSELRRKMVPENGRQPGLAEHHDDADTGNRYRRSLFAAIYINISDRKRAEAALRASEERWRAMFENARSAS
jgi:PAS domain-containing protein